MGKIYVITFIIGLVLIISSYTQTDALTKSIAAGKEVYIEYCALCHKADGSGKKEIVPPLMDADFLKNRQQTLHAIKYGLKGPITVNGLKFNGIMTSQNLSNQEIADVTNYIFNSWGNKIGKIVTEVEVEKVVK